VRNNHQVGGALLYRPVDPDFFRHLNNNIPFKELDGQRRGAAAQNFRNGVDGIVAVIVRNDQRGAGFRFGIKSEGNFSDNASRPVLLIISCNKSKPWLFFNQFAAEIDDFAGG